MKTFQVMFKGKHFWPKNLKQAKLMFMYYSNRNTFLDTQKLRNNIHLLFLKKLREDVLELTQKMFTIKILIANK